MARLLFHFQAQPFPKNESRQSCLYAESKETSCSQEQNHGVDMEEPYPHFNSLLYIIHYYICRNRNLSDIPYQPLYRIALYTLYPEFLRCRFSNLDLERLSHASHQPNFAAIR